MNGFWWNHERVKVGYPNIRPTDDAAGSCYYYHCSDNDDTWSLACDEVEDLLAYYSHPAVRSYGFEMTGQGRCACPDTMNLFARALKAAGLEGDDGSETRQEFFRLWQAMRRKQVLAEFVLAIKKIRPTIEIWHHGYMELGDYGGYRYSASSCRKAGVDVAMPCIHTVTDEDTLRKVLESSEDFPVALHVDTRNAPTKNYPIPLKTPEDILNMGRWMAQGNRPNLVGAVFFNEAATSRENKKAVYDVLKRWRKGGLV